MTVPEFRFYDLNPALRLSDPGDAFQRFVCECLRHNYPGLEFFPASGKDGAIDLSWTGGPKRTIVETKYIDQEKPFTAAQREWRSIAERLRKHLVDPQGPTKGQSQYLPWYSTNPAITEYHFCISGCLANQNQKDTLKGEISNCFQQLAGDHNHLSHLRDLVIWVQDWNDLSQLVAQQSYLLFRWFPKERPMGLVPLEKGESYTGFRKYLTQERIPYLSRRAFLDADQTDTATSVQDEEALFSLLNDSLVSGLVITGSGGVGKTRLSIELGWLALDRGWILLVVGQRARPAALHRLAEKITPETPVLLLIDYIETQQEFVEFSQELTDLNNTYGLRLRFLANCRSSYYHALEGAVDHIRIDLSPPQEAKSAPDWSQRYRHAIVRHILSAGGIRIDGRHLALCRDTPILAVFMHYLVATNHQPLLEELLTEGDFGDWIIKRVRRTLHGGDIDRELALLMTLFPIPETALSGLLEVGQLGKLVERLEPDGWIAKEATDGESTWMAIHDVFADRIILSYLDRARGTTTLFVQSVLELAEKHGSLASAFTTLQRLGDQPLIADLPWLQILEARLRSRPDTWRDIRAMLLRTPLLSEAERLDLLSVETSAWDGAEEAVDFQNSIGWLARWASREENHGTLSEARHATLVQWVQRASAHASQNNYLLTSGLRFCPADVRNAALAWMIARPALFQTHYSLVAWLEAKFPPRDVSPIIGQWLNRFPLVVHGSFVFRGWLDTAGREGLELVREPIRHWLAQHKTLSEAGFVYRGWLDAARKQATEKDLDLVREPIRNWLENQETRDNLEASFVYRSWLDAAGREGLELVREPIRHWLDNQENRDNLVASFVYRSWLDAAGREGLDLVRAHIDHWLKQHEILPEAQFVYRGWLEAAGRDGLDLVRAHIERWLEHYQAHAEADYVYRCWMEAGGEFSFIKAGVIQWLAENRERREAVFVTKSLARQKDLPAGAVQDVLVWCRTFAEDEDALWRATQLGDHLFRDDVAEDVIQTAEVLIGTRLILTMPLQPRMSNLIDKLFSFLICGRSLQNGPLLSRVDKLFVQWLWHHASFHIKSQHRTEGFRRTDRRATIPSSIGWRRRS